jgi:hypothetical protein
MFKRLLAVSTAMLLTVATAVIAQDLRADHPTTYVVQKGDTLWDISAKFLTKPWLWPEIWQANPQVKNPHLIYPGDVLSLVYVNGQPRITPGPEPEIRRGESVDTVPLSEIEPWLKPLTVVQDPKSFPYVVGVEEDRLLSSAGMLAYVRGMQGAQPGQLVQVARPVNEFGMARVKGKWVGGVIATDFRGDRLHSHWGYGDHPMDAHGEKLGVEMMLHSIGEVLRQQGEVTVVLLREEGREVRVGDRILPVEAQPYCNCFIPHAAPGGVAEHAQVLAIADGLRFAGPRMVVALSVGRADGVDNGSTFSIWHRGALRPDIVRNRGEMAANGDKVQMPDDFIGHVMVFRTFERVSYGLIMDGIRPARTGDVLKHPDATQ